MTISSCKMSDKIERKDNCVYRVSTNDQVEKHTNENQMNSIMRFSESLDIGVVKIFEDLGKSGTDKLREGFDSMLKEIENDPTITGIIVFDIDRLARDIIISMDLMNFLMKNGIKVYESRTEKIHNLNDDSDQLLYFIGSWFSSIERKKIKARQKEGIKRYIEENGRWGRKKKWGKSVRTGKQMSREAFIREYNNLRPKLSKAAIARMFEVDICTLNRRLQEVQ